MPHDLNEQKVNSADAFKDVAEGDGRHVVSALSHEQSKKLISGRKDVVADGLEEPVRERDVAALVEELTVLDRVVLHPFRCRHREG